MKALESALTNILGHAESKHNSLRPLSMLAAFSNENFKYEEEGARAVAL